MKKKLAFVLGGGGSRGALQAGALHALLETGYHPDLVTGTSIGAANASFLAIHGYTPKGTEMLEEVWRATVDQDLLPTNLWWQTMRLFFRRPDTDTKEKIREFAIASGISPNLCFKDIHEPRLFIVASDLIAGCPVIFGVDPNEKVLDCLLASIALPPWMTPMERDGQYLVDGGAVSNLPIEAALQLGATEIIALDLFDPNMVDSSARGLGPFFLRLDKTIEHRQIVLEMKLAEARGVHVRRLNLVGVPPVPLWDFSRSSELIERGYQLTHQAIASWKDVEINSWKTKAGWRDVLEGLIEVLE